MHVHPALPWIGAAWRTRFQDFQSSALGDGGPPAPGRIYGAAFYVTYALRPAAARRALFLSLEGFRARTKRIILGRGDLPGPDLPNAWEESCFLAVESMRCLRDPGDVRRLWDQGVRSLQPIHFLDTPWGGSSREGLLPSSRTGLTGMGREMLAEMAALGLILDLAHMSLPNAEQCLAAYPGPVMCSHTGISSIRSTARNITPDLAREIFRRRGLVGVTCWRQLLGKGTAAGWTRSYCETATALADLHADARVAIGSDRGAPINAPSWFYGPGNLAEMAAILIGMGWTPGRLHGFFSGNAVDFLSSALPAAGRGPTRLRDAF